MKAHPPKTGKNAFNIHKGLTMVNYVIHYRGKNGVVTDVVVNDRNLLHTLEWINKMNFDLIGYELLS